MLRRLIVFLGIWICIAKAFSPQENRAVPGSDAILARQASMDMSSIALRSLADSMKAGREAKTQGYPAAAIAKWAQALPRMFPDGTGEGETTVTTQARILISRDRIGFDRAAATYADAAARLAALATANDTPGFTSQLAEVDRACRVCHAGYKAGAQGPPGK